MRVSIVDGVVGRTNSELLAGHVTRTAPRNALLPLEPKIVTNNLHYSHATLLRLPIQLLFVVCMEEAPRPFIRRWTASRVTSSTPPKLRQTTPATNEHQPETLKTI
jgi:hypothetical protein